MSAPEVVDLSYYAGGFFQLYCCYVVKVQVFNVLLIFLYNNVNMFKYAAALMLSGFAGWFLFVLFDIKRTYYNSYSCSFIS